MGLRLADVFLLRLVLLPYVTLHGLLSGFSHGLKVFCLVLQVQYIMIGDSISILQSDRHLKVRVDENRAVLCGLGSVLRRWLQNGMFLI